MERLFSRHVLTLVDTMALYGAMPHRCSCYLGTCRRHVWHLLTPWPYTEQWHLFAAANWTHVDAMFMNWVHGEVIFSSCFDTCWQGGLIRHVLTLIDTMALDGALTPIRSCELGTCRRHVCELGTWRGYFLVMFWHLLTAWPYTEQCHICAAVTWVHVDVMFFDTCWHHDLIRSIDTYSQLRIGYM